MRRSRAMSSPRPARLFGAPAAGAEQDVDGLTELLDEKFTLNASSQWRPPAPTMARTFCDPVKPIIVTPLVTFGMELSIISAVGAP